MLSTYYMDLHVHIGRTEAGQSVKISGSKNLTFYNIAEEASKRKGIHLIGIVDGHSPGVLAEVEHYIQKGQMYELPEGGIRYGDTTILLGSEIEVRDPGMGPAHLLAFFPKLVNMRAFSAWMSLHMKNIHLSSQRIYVTAKVLQDVVQSHGGMMIPAHIFSPHRSIYGSCSDRMADLLHLDTLAAVELGLSADTRMANQLSELDRFQFVTNSDAHSLSKIAREYNAVRLAEPNYEEVLQALAGKNGRTIEANYGLNPLLGKYYRTYCSNCSETMEEGQITVAKCTYCGSNKIVRGVWDRIQSIADREYGGTSVVERQPYHYQVPLEFIQGFGARLLDRLIAELGTEMFILHHAAIADISHIAGEKIANQMMAARSGELQLKAGGGGFYGRVSL